MQVPRNVMTVFLLKRLHMEQNGVTMSSKIMKAIVAYLRH